MHSFTGPNLYIPMSTTYIFDYRERAYYDDPKWNEYFFTGKSIPCGGVTSFECNRFIYNREFPDGARNRYHIFTTLYSGGYTRAAEIPRVVNTFGLNIKHFHALDLFDNESYPFVPHRGASWKEARLVSGQVQCLLTAELDYCQSTVSSLVLDPYWKTIYVYGKNTGQFLDAFMISDELRKTLFKSEDITVRVCVCFCLYFMCICVCLRVYACVYVLRLGQCHKS